MTTLRPPSRDTHTVANQPPPLVGVDTYALNPALVEAVAREGGDWAADELSSLGQLAGSEEAQEHSVRADRNEPRLRTHDRYGNRVDTVEYDPSWQWLLGHGIAAGIPGQPWRDPRPGAHVARAAKHLLWSGVNAGVMCPLTMTYAAVPALRADSALQAEFEPRLTDPDPAAAALAGMAMTEKQGGSDVRAATTEATEIGDGWWELTGHKWFCSHPMGDVFLVLAQAPELTCFVVQRGPGMQLMRLKDKFGTRSLASSEVEFRACPARALGPEGRGVATIIEMVGHTRLDCAIGSAGGMRRAVAEAIWHARHRRTFGAPLAEHPLMVNVLADLALESEAATVSAIRLARAYDEDDGPFKRFATAVLKYWICKRVTAHAAEAMECLGGNGYVDEAPLAMLLRDAPVNGIWEGSGNVMCLDVLRALARDPEGLPALLAECELARGGDPRFDAHLDALPATLAEGEHEWRARAIVADLALALQASLLIRHSPPVVADAFCAARLGARGGFAYGTLPAGVDGAAILARTLPV